MIRWTTKQIRVRLTKEGEVYEQDAGKLEAAEADGWEHYDTQGTGDDRLEYRLRRPEEEVPVTDTSEAQEASAGPDNMGSTPIDSSEPTNDKDDGE